jgi:hypothetical protein
VPELSGRELLHEWRRLMDSVIASAGSAAGRSDLPRNLLRAMQRQLELMGEIIERERRLQRELAGSLIAPVDAVFDLLEETGATLRQQAEALETSASALEDAAGLVKRQAELFERTVGTLRRPAEFAKAATGLDRRPRKGERGGPRRPRAPRA